MQRTLIVVLALAGSQWAIAAGTTRDGDRSNIALQVVTQSTGANAGDAKSVNQVARVKSKSKSKSKSKKPRSTPPTIATHPAVAPAAAVSAAPRAIGSQTATVSASPVPAESFQATPSGSMARPVVPADGRNGITPTIAANATASVTPIQATLPAAGSDDNSKAAAPFKPRMAVKARIDDGRSSGFHQNGGDQPAGDQQFRPADRVQAENKRLSRESGERKPTPPEAASTPAMRDQSTIVRTQ